ncbi:hypothetical protein Ddye_020616 [Dipteronia dyeriana]|uniref:Uncharacterized protein n=1 Tax=Dipteronia dyeriana TaxID=168575 RepID=A0AAD9WW56_9ROSI|nr:hypothetical protein Ddye_020616 [Dipteronia dyeriana]
MAITKSSRAYTKNAKIVLVLFLALAAICEANVVDDDDEFDVAEAMERAKADKADPSEKIFNVMKYGAVTGDREDPTGEITDNNHAAFVQAFLAACHHTGKARVVIPTGTYLLGPVTFQGPCNNPEPLVVQIQGTLKAATDLSLFPGEGQEWFNFEDINGLIVTGTGVFDGQGASAWKYRDPKTDNDAPGQRMPASIQFVNVTNAVMRGITSINSKGFHIFITQSQNIRLYHLRITAPENSPNTDGIHISQSNLIKVAKSIIATGDDCVGIIRGANNVSIKKVTCGPGHGISVGSLGKFENETDVRGIIVRNCTLIGTANGVRIKTTEGKNPAHASGLIFQDIMMQDVKHPIVINQLYETKKDSIVKISDVHFTNIWGTSVSKVAVDLQCSKQSPCENVQFKDINLKYSGVESQVPFSSSCVNAKVGYTGSQFPPPCNN